jgi:CMP-N,N'-diacetyllegionaminic acid synthase
MNTGRILTIIPARGGSKRLPGKHLRLFLDKPLIAYAIDAAKGSKYIDRLIVTTDDKEIAAVAKECGADVPFMRPPELATDTAPTLPVLQHAVAFLEKEGEKFDTIVLLQPTVPGVLAQHVDAAIEKLLETHTNSCVSVCEIVDRPEWMYHLDQKGNATPYSIEDPAVRSQDLPKLYRLNGAVYVTTRDVLMNGNKIVDDASCSAVIMPRERSVDIDTAADFALAEQLLKEFQHR